MKRVVLGFAVAAAAVFAAPIPAQASYCGGTFQPPCEICPIEWTGIPQCVSIEIRPEG